MKVQQTTIELMQGDIVSAGTEAIVNAANSYLAGGGGVDGAIHRAAGPELYQMTAVFGGCPTGSAVITGAGQIPPPTRYIIHAVGPVYHADHDSRCASSLAGAYRRSMELAEDKGVASIAFPSISTGAYGYPIASAAPIAIKAVADYLGGRAGNSVICRVVFVAFSASDLKAYQRALDATSRL